MSLCLASTRAGGSLAKLEIDANGSLQTLHLPCSFTPAQHPLNRFNLCQYHRANGLKMLLFKWQSGSMAQTCGTLWTNACWHVNTKKSGMCQEFPIPIAQPLDMSPSSPRPALPGPFTTSPRTFQVGHSFEAQFTLSSPNCFWQQDFHVGVQFQ